MIVAFSTSSPWTSVALIRGSDVWSARKHSPQQASTACLELLQEGFLATGASLAEAELFAADLGPGSFTGVRVGIVMAKTFAWQFNKPCIGADAFDLVAPNQLVALPSKRGEWFVRQPGQALRRTTTLPVGVVGYGFPDGDLTPNAANFASLAHLLTPVSAAELVPAYLIEPSISTPKVPFAGVRS